MSKNVRHNDVEADSQELADTSHQEIAPQDPTRRHFFEFGSLVLGAFVGIGPALIGLLAFLDPLRRTPTKPTSHQEKAGGGNDRFIRVASIDALLMNVPQRVLVVDDQMDAWNFTPDQPIGAVYIEKMGPAALRVFNATCPHAGCSVACNGVEYRCPCHNSSFELDGSKLVSESGRENPSPRDMDSLEYELRDGDIWIDFKNFYTGKPEKKEKA